MSYRLRFADGSARQYVVIAAGGHARAGTTLGDHLVAWYDVNVGINNCHKGFLHILIPHTSCL